MAEQLTKNNLDHLVEKYLTSPNEDTKQLLIHSCSNFIEQIARKYSGIEPVDDLVQVGYIGLLNALGRFKLDSGVRFQTYATHLIVGEIKHYLRDRALIIRHPAWLQELRHKINRSGVLLTAELGRPPEKHEIANKLGIQESIVTDILARQEALKMVSLSSSNGTDDDSNAETDHVDPSTVKFAATSIEDKLLLEKAINQLRDLERTVLVLFHFESLTQGEIAEKLGISCNYVSYILRQSLSKLKKLIQVSDSSQNKNKHFPGITNSNKLEIFNSYPSGNYFISRLEEEIHRSVSNNNELTIGMIHLEGYLDYENFYGSDGLLDILIEIGEVIKNRIRKIDTMCRWENNSFLVIFPTQGINFQLIGDTLDSELKEWHQNTKTSLKNLRICTSFIKHEKHSANDIIEVARKRLLPLVNYPGTLE